MSDFQKQYALWDEFLSVWPASRLATMTLDEYTQAGSKDSFTYWKKVRGFVVPVADWAAQGDLNAIESFEHLGEAEDGIHWRAQLVAHAGKKIGLGLIGAFGPFAGIHQRQQYCLAFGNVFHDRYTMDQNAFLVIDGRENRQLPEQASILAP